MMERKEALQTLNDFINNHARDLEERTHLHDCLSNIER